MNTILLNILAIAVVIVIGSVAYIKLSPEMQMPTDDTPIDDMILKCIADSWKMQYEINASTSMAELQTWYWEVEHFESSYTNLVPDGFLKQQSDRLYDAVTIRRDQLNGVVAA